MYSGGVSSYLLSPQVQIYKLPLLSTIHLGRVNYYLYSSQIQIYKLLPLTPLQQTKPQKLQPPLRNENMASKRLETAKKVRWPLRNSRHPNSRISPRRKPSPSIRANIKESTRTIRQTRVPCTFPPAPQHNDRFSCDREGVHRKRKWESSYGMGHEPNCFS
jgi:hypothetical protein